MPIECLPLLKWLDAEFSKHHPEYYVVRNEDYLDSNHYKYEWNFMQIAGHNTIRVSELPYEEMKHYKNI